MRGEKSPTSLATIGQDTNKACTTSIIGCALLMDILCKCDVRTCCPIIDFSATGLLSPHPPLSHPRLTLIMDECPSVTEYMIGFISVMVSVHCPRLGPFFQMPSLPSLLGPTGTCVGNGAGDAFSRTGK
jgi:hypothetical protein